jgi:pyruvate kinase
MAPAADAPLPTATDTMAQAACQIATRLQVEAIGTVTLSGFTARFVAKYRPSQPILAVTPQAETYRQLALVRGVTPMLLSETAPTREEPMRAAAALARERG